MQKLAQPLEGGQNLIFRVQFVDDSAMLNKLDIYQNGSFAMTLKDEGIYPDSVARDFKYAAYIKVDSVVFKSKIQALEAKWQSEGTVTYFEGHNAKELPFDPSLLFDFYSFNSFQEVHFNPYILEFTNCNENLKKEKSLFITDLNVVENLSTTYNIISKQGNPQGAWTFGTLIKNACNEPITGKEPREFLREWLKLGRMSNSYVGQFIIPWIVKARRESGSPSYMYTAPLTINGNFINPQWEVEWNQTDEDALLENAPFKLTAIVNRLDLRGSMAYSGVKNAGETRFIFTYIIPVESPYHTNISDMDLNINPNVPPGNPFFHNFMDFNNGWPGEIESTYKDDWKGMNIIFEYSNIQNSFCELKSFANQWANLSNYNFTDPSFIAELTSITNSVTHSNSNLLMPNGSALARIRSNEKCFAPRDVNAGNGGPLWDKMNWEFRQFEINPITHLFTLRPLTNTPDSFFNFAKNINVHDGTDYPVLQNSEDPYALLDWIYSSNIIKERVKRENHLIPESFTPANNAYTAYFLSKLTAQVSGEVVHFFGFDTISFAAKYPALPTNAQLAEAKLIRHNISLQTCQGCHAGETKTTFTHVKPIGYGVDADYWSAVPKTVPGTMNNNMATPNLYGQYFTDFDVRYSGVSGGDFYYFNNGIKGNVGRTETLPAIAAANYSLNQIGSKSHFQIVSPFLTGRIYNGIINGADNWVDDNIDPNAGDNNPLNLLSFDSKLTGKFFVNDPSNNYLPGFGFQNAQEFTFPYLSKQQWTFNDLKKRSDHLCDILNRDCMSLDVNLFSLIKEMNQIPLPLGAH